MRTPIREKYYAIRIGDPRRHKPYLMLDPNRISVPLLFPEKEDADAFLKDYPGTCRKVLRVFITT